MTLLMFAKGNDGFVIASDRKETIDAGLGNDVEKYVLCADGDFFLALAGDGRFNEGLYAHLSRNRAGDISQTIMAYRHEYFGRYQQIRVQDYGSGESEGFFVLREHKRHIPYTLRTIGDECRISRIRYPLHAVGSPEAVLIACHTLRNVNFAQFPCEAVARFLLASMNDAAQTIDMVGGFDYGLDVVAFMDDGQILCHRQYADERTRVKIRFESAPKTLLSECATDGA